MSENYLTLRSYNIFGSRVRIGIKYENRQEYERFHFSSKLVKRLNYSVLEPFYMVSIDDQ